MYDYMLNTFHTFYEDQIINDNSVLLYFILYSYIFMNV